MENNNNESSGYGCAITILIIGAASVFSGYSLFGWICVVLGILTIMGLAGAKKNQEENGSKEKAAAIPTKSVTHPSPGVTLKVSMGDDDLQEYSVKGINFAGITDSLIGDHVGYVRALKSNEHDPYAIGVYVGKKRIGHLPRGNQELHNRITEEGGSVDAYIYIGKMRDEDDGHYFYYGKVKPII